MRQDELLDDLIRGEFQSDFSEEIPESYLTDINQRLDALQRQKKKKRAIIFWWLSGTFSIITGLIIVLTWMNVFTKNQVIGSNATNKGSQPINQTKSTNKGVIKSDYSLVQATNNTISNSEKRKENQIIKEFLVPKTQRNSDIGINENKHVIPVDSTETTKIVEDEPLDSNNLQYQIAQESIIDKEDSLLKMKLRDQTLITCSRGELTIPEKNKKDRISSHYMGFYTGISSVESIFRESNTPILSAVYTQKNYQEKRKAEEIGITSWDVSVKYVFNYKGYTLSSGLDYFVWGEKTDYSNVNYSAQFLNKYQYLNIPINIGYSVRVGKYGINPFVGISVGRLMKETNGYYLNSQSLSSAFQATISPCASTINGGVELSYYSQSGIKVSLMPITRFSVRQIVNTEMVSTNYFSIGLNLGIGYCW
jgi:hypothetical protein